jgi:hypothetical protein
MYITPAYQLEQQRLHDNPAYGVASLHFAPIVEKLLRQTAFKTILDYGAGKRRLREALGPIIKDAGLEYFACDPAFPEYGKPTPADLVCCIDVLEHVEAQFLDEIFHELASNTLGLAFLTIHMGPAGKTLSDGRNAHLIQKPQSWWLPRISQYFDVIHLESHNMMGRGVWMVAKPVNANV